MSKKTLTTTPFWFREWQGISKHKAWKRVFVQQTESGVRLVHRTGTSKAVHTHLTGVLPSLNHALFYAKDMCVERPGGWRLRGELPYECQDTVISAPHPNYNRFKAAYDLQNACNPSGVARELVRIINAAQRDPEYTGTDYIRNDAAVVIVIDKLKSLCLKNDFAAQDECREKAKIIDPTSR